jgi:hypothetical protein
VLQRILGSAPVDRTTGEGRNEAPESLLVSPSRERRTVVLPDPTESELQYRSKRRSDWTHQDQG